MTTSLNDKRKTLRYRIFESVLAITTYGFFLVIFLLSFFAPHIAAAIILIYSFGWLLRIALINLYTIFTFKNLNRWKTVPAYSWISRLKTDTENVKKEMVEFKNKYAGKIHHAYDMNKLLTEVDKNKNTKFEDPNAIWQLPIFAIYNESPEVLTKSLRAVYESEYNKERIVVCITQEARLGSEKNQAFRDALCEIPWIALHEVPSIPVQTVYRDDHASLKYNNRFLKELNFDPKKLNVLCTAHPDGLTGEIKGKASNEDWAGRVLSLFTKSKGIDPELCVVTSLDADSSVSKDYFALLSLRYALTDKTHGRFGFQSIPVYTKNIFETTLIPRMIAFQTTLWTMAQNGLEGKTHFFANYSVPLVVLQEVNFWDREHIAEDYLFYARCFTKYNGNFRVLPFYGMFNGDAVIGDDYVHALENQYKQHQRWSWGGVESIAYLLEKLFVEKNTIPLRKKIKEFTGVFLNHHFWATAPLLFSVGVILPVLFGGINFEQSYIAQNLSLFSTYFAVISYFFVFIVAFLSYSILLRTADLKESTKVQQIIMVVMQAVLTPLSYAYMAIPAINAQTRGLVGNYLGYWVTPKK